MERHLNERNIPFSPPDISELEIREVSDALRSGWITTGPRTKLLEARLAAYIDTGRTDIDCADPETGKKYANRVACLSSATAAEEPARIPVRLPSVGKPPPSTVQQRPPASSTIRAPAA